MARHLISAALTVCVVALCVVASLAGAPVHAAHTVHSPVAAPRMVTLGMGYLPNVQFAPFYVAQERGYYRRAGLQVTFDYALSSNLVQLVGAGRDDFANADGTDVIAAAAHGIPVSYVMAEYQQLPIAIFALAKSGIHSIAGLRGRTIGIPGLYGSTYIGLLAALRAAGLGPNDVKIVPINYTQVESVAAGKVDAAVGYSDNEPLQLARRGYKLVTLEVGSATGLVAPGVVAGHGLISRDPRLVRAFVQATLHGLADTIRDPRAAFAASLKVPSLSTLHGRAAADQYAVLLKAIEFWHGAATRAHGLGYSDLARWRSSARLLHTLGQSVPARLPGGIVTNTFAAGAAKL